MRNKIIFAIVLALLVLPLAMAQPVFTFKEKTAAQIKVTCLDNNNNPFVAGTALLTIDYPNGTNLILNRVMTLITPEFNFTLSPTQTTPNGIYTAGVFCNAAGVASDSFPSFTYEVNPTGIPSTQDRSIAISRASYLIFGIAILLFLGFVFLGESKHFDDTLGEVVIVSKPAIKWTFFILFLVFTSIGSNIVLAGLHNEVVDQNIEKIFSFISAASIYFYYFAGGLLIIIWVLSIFNTMNERFSSEKLIKYGGESKQGRRPQPTEIDGE